MFAKRSRNSHMHIARPFLHGADSCWHKPFILNVISVAGVLIRHYTFLLSSPVCANAPRACSPQSKAYIRGPRERSSAADAPPVLGRTRERTASLLLPCAARTILPTTRHHVRSRWCCACNTVHISGQRAPRSRRLRGGEVSTGALQAMPRAT